MYNSLLATLIAVADCGSFTKAAERLYISPTAVMKQINALEKHLDLKLLDRTATGVRLTAAGAVIDQDARFLIDYSNKSVASAKMAARAEQTTFRVGTSLLNPAKPFMDLWYRVNRYFPDYKSSDVLQDLKNVANITGMSLTDAERLAIIDNAYRSLLNYRNLVNYYTRKNISVSYLREIGRAHV